MTDIEKGLAEADCAEVLTKVYEFLDHEVNAGDGDAIRAHLAGCEPCLEKYDVEQAVKSLVGRCCGDEVAPEHLRAKVLGVIAQAQQRAVADQ